MQSVRMSQPSLPISGRRAPLAVFAGLWVCAALLALPASPAAAASQSQYFQQTGRTIAGKFLAYWRANGGLAIFGYPITDAQNAVDPITGKAFLSQWFERERFELHPEYAGTPYEVELGLLGRQVTQHRQNEVPFRRGPLVPDTPSRVFFPQTGHALALGFKTYWEAHGGLAIFGYPISEEFQERNPSDGATYTIQYFERARFEYHPANPAPYTVELGLLGTQLAGSITTPAMPTIQVSAGSSPITIGPDQTALVPPGSVDLAISVLYPQPVDQQPEIRLSQPAGRAAWQFAPDARNTRTRFAYNFRLRAAPNSSSYFQVEVIRGTMNAALFFGIQVGSSVANLPSLVADWTDPVALVTSFYNAVNRKEYLRAYSYWDSPGNANAVSASFDDFIRGYAGTAAVQVATGAVQSGAGAGNIYYAVPVALAATQIDGSIRRFYGCYLLHGINVDIENTRPPYPISIRAAHIFAAPANARSAALLDQAAAFVQANKCTE